MTTLQINIKGVTRSVTAEEALKHLSGKWKMQILLQSAQGPVRFNQLLRVIQGSNKQSIAVALRDLEGCGLIIQKVISKKPLNIEYSITEKGKKILSLVGSIFELSPDNQL
jgi:DNA-binding HxlR family transcriptional regulator